MDEESEFEQLYQRFRAAINSGSESLYFDENDLIDIFDYAGDIGDERIRLEALVMGARLFPDSSELRQRRAIFLSSINVDAFRDYMQTAAEEDSLLWKILEVRANMPSASEAIAALENLIDKYSLNEDEEIIQFVALAKDLNQFDWIYDNIDKIRSKSKYETTLLYEVARQSYTEPQLTKGLALLDELTMLDPFSIDYWNLLADFQISLNRIDEALTSLSYAKAISPENIATLSLEGTALLMLERYDAAIKVLQQAVKLDSSFDQSKVQLEKALHYAGRLKEAASLAKELFAADPSDPNLFLEVLLLDSNDCEAVVSSYYEATGEQDESSMLQRVADLTFGGAPESAFRYLNWYANKFGLSQSGKAVFLELLYMNGLYDAAFTYMTHAFNDSTITPSDIALVVIIASVYLRKHMFTEAKSFSEKWLRELESVNYPNITYSILGTGVKVKLRAIKQLLTDSPNPSDEEINAVVV